MDLSEAKGGNKCNSALEILCNPLKMFTLNSWGASTVRFATTSLTERSLAPGTWIHEGKGHLGRDENHFLSPQLSWGRSTLVLWGLWAGPGQGAAWRRWFCFHSQWGGPSARDLPRWTQVVAPWEWTPLPATVGGYWWPRPVLSKPSCVWQLCMAITVFRNWTLKVCLWSPLRVWLKNMVFL